MGNRILRMRIQSHQAQRCSRFGARAMYADEEAGDMGWTPDLVDAPVSAGDGFSFEGGERGNEIAGSGVQPSPAGTTAEGGKGDWRREEQTDVELPGE